MKTKQIFIKFIHYLVTILVLISSGCTTEGRQVKNSFHILSYNVLMGLQQDSIIKKQFISWVKKIDPLIVAYQEMNHFTQNNLEEFASQYAHPYAIQSKEDGFPVSLTSKVPIVNVQKITDNMHHAYLYAMINGIHVFVIHFSPFSYKKRNEEVRTILAHAALLPQSEKILIMGDFNAISESDAKHYTEEYLAARMNSEGGRRQNLRDGKLDYSVINMIENAGFLDTYRMFNSEFKISIPTSKYGPREGGGSRIDFVFVNPTLSKYVVSADIIHDPETNVMSDHYPMLVGFEMD